MKLLQTLMAGVLGTATLLPALPAWAEANTPPAGVDAGSVNAGPKNAGTAGAHDPGTAKSENTGPDSSKPVNQQNAPATADASTGKAGAGQATGQASNQVTEQVTKNDGSAGMRDRMRMRRDDRKAFFDARLAALHAGLQLTPSQRPLWPPVEAAIRDLSRARHGGHHRGDDEMNGTEWLKMRSARLIAVGNALGKLADATGPLLGALTPEQKNRLPILLRGVGPRRAIAQAFGVEDMMGSSEQPWRDRFREDDDRRGSFNMKGDEDEYRGWERHGHADRFGPEDGRFGRGEDMFFNNRHDLSDGGRMSDERMGDEPMGD